MRISNQKGWFQLAIPYRHTWSHSRRKAPEEKKGGTKLSKHGVQIRCGYCKGPGHNRAGCDLFKAEQLAQAEANGEDNVKDDQAGTSSKPARRKRKTVHEQVSVPNPIRQPTTIDEYGDADVPEIREHIVHVDLDPALDPTHMRDSMVSQLGHETPAVIFTEHEPLPQESLFVAQHREGIPTRVRVTTATSSGHSIMRGRRRGRATGTGRSTAAAQAGTSSRTTSTSAPATRTTRAPTTATTSAPATRTTRAPTSATTRATTRAATASTTRGTSNTPAPRGRGGRTIGRGEWLLFGNAGADGDADATDLQNTQEPPAV